MGSGVPSAFRRSRAAWDVAAVPPTRLPATRIFPSGPTAEEAAVKFSRVAPPPAQVVSVVPDVGPPATETWNVAVASLATSLLASTMLPPGATMV